jgi:hypothetical protein
MEFKVGTGYTPRLIVKLKEFEKQQAGCAFWTFTCAVPGRGMSAVGTVAVSWVELTNVVTRGAPLK